MIVHDDDDDDDDDDVLVLVGTRWCFVAEQLVQ